MNSYMYDGDHLSQLASFPTSFDTVGNPKPQHPAGGAPVGHLGGHDGPFVYDAAGNEKFVSRVTGQYFPERAGCRAALGLGHQRARLDVEKRVRRRGPAPRDAAEPVRLLGPPHGVHRAALRRAWPPRVDADAARHGSHPGAVALRARAPRAPNGVGRRAGAGRAPERVIHGPRRHRRRVSRLGRRWRTVRPIHRARRATCRTARNTQSRVHRRRDGGRGAVHLRHGPRRSARAVEDGSGVGLVPGPR